MSVSLTFTNNFKKVSKQIEKVEKQRMLKIVNMVRNDAIKSMSGGKSGRIYRKPGQKVKYQASKAGEAPARPTGTLARNIKTRVRKAGVLRRVIGEVGVPDRRVSKKNVKGSYNIGKVALGLEFGTSKMDKRPFLTPAFKKNEKEIKKILRFRWF